jgi:DNA topoisomerase-1
MTSKLVIVESPAKAKTINRYLGGDFAVKASMGHIKDLPKKELGVDEERGFNPTYIVIPEKEKVLSELKKTAKGINDVYLATDPDREGEAISWHLSNELAAPGKRFHRVLLTEITKKGVDKAFSQPTEIDKRKVDAQQARRVLDRLVGYKISPLLWDKVKRGLSAGRVQSVALKLICDREREIESFVPDESWSITAELSYAGSPPFTARLVKKEGKNLKLKTKEETDEVIAELKKLPFIVSGVKVEEKNKRPTPPFTTSKLQQEAFRKLGFPVRKTMRIAQWLYEGKDLGGGERVGLITYMRTDSVRVAVSAIAEAREFIKGSFGSRFIPDKPNVYKNKKGIEDAHEAIRPTSVSRHPEAVKSYLTKEEYRLYLLIWQKFLASQMSPARYIEHTIEIEAGRYLFRASASKLVFPGFLAVYKDEKGEEFIPLPELKKGCPIDLTSLTPKQHFSQPPPRYNEGSLVKELEEKGVGRPSTYAVIISTIADRGYVIREKRCLFPSELGFVVYDLLSENFNDLLDVGYTARMEEKLDQVEEGKLNWVDALGEFYRRLKEDLSRAEQNMRDVKREVIETGEACPVCSAKLLKKWGRFGYFLACSRYPDCKYTREIEPAGGGENEKELLKKRCPKCGSPMTVKRGKFGYFLACSNYPDCKTTIKLVKDKEGGMTPAEEQVLDEACPVCSAKLVKKVGRYGPFIACSNYPNCTYIKPKETGVFCPREGCGGKIVEKRGKRGRTFYGCTNYPNCDFTLSRRPVARKCPRCGSSYLLLKSKKGGKLQLICPNKSCDYQVVEEKSPEKKD